MVVVEEVLYWVALVRVELPVELRVAVKTSDEAVPVTFRVLVPDPPST